MATYTATIHIIMATIDLIQHVNMSTRAILQVDILIITTLTMFIHTVILDQESHGNPSPTMIPTRTFTVQIMECIEDAIQFQQA